MDCTGLRSISTRAHRPSPRSTAFTIIELIVVLGIIAVLVGITLGIAQRVSSSGKARATELLIQSLDTMTDAYFEQAGTTDISTLVVVTDIPSGGGPTTRYAVPLIDAVPVDAGGQPLVVSASGQPVAHVASAAFFELMRQRSTAAAKAIESLDVTFARRGGGQLIADRYAVFGWELDNNGQPTGTLQPLPIQIRYPIDAWGNPVHFVNPTFQGGAGDTYATGTLVSRDLFTIGGVNFRRSARPVNSAATVGDADEGFVTTARPYWYSAGADGDAGTIDDNVYTVRARFDVTTIPG